jgi:hypothetical protein
VTDSADPLIAVEEFAEDARYAWWRNTHPGGYILAVRARQAPVLHRAACAEVDRDRHPGRLKAAGSRQVCAETKPALRAWVAREGAGPARVLERCPKCSP